mgnify:CR=1 FL=1
MKILIVEDEPAIADTIQYALETDGFQTLHLQLGLPVLPLLAKESVALIILDMSEVEMINSAGAGILAAMLTSTRNQDGSLALVGLSERNRRVLEFLHLHQFARFCDTVEQAREAAF